MHVPMAPSCLLSIPRLNEEKGDTRFSNGRIFLLHDGKPWIEGTKKDRLFLMDVRARTNERAFSTHDNTPASWDV